MSAGLTQGMRQREAESTTAMMLALSEVCRGYGQKLQLCRGRHTCSRSYWHTQVLVPCCPAIAQDDTCVAAAF